jgi:hypothetical protein
MPNNHTIAGESLSKSMNSLHAGTFGSANILAAQSRPSLKSPVAKLSKSQVRLNVPAGSAASINRADSKEHLNHWIHDVEKKLKLAEENFLEIRKSESSLGELSSKSSLDDPSTNVTCA